MFDNGRKTIGVFVSELHSDFQTILSQGITERAKELNYNVLYFTNFGGYGESLYNEGEVLIADLPNYADFDGIIIVPDTFRIVGLEERIRKNIESNSDCRLFLLGIRLMNMTMF